MGTIFLAGPLVIRQEEMALNQKEDFYECGETGTGCSERW